MSKRNPRILNGRAMDLDTLIGYDLITTQEMIEQALDEHAEITRGYTTAIERMNHFADCMEDALDFLSLGSARGMPLVDEFAVSLF